MNDEQRKEILYAYAVEPTHDRDTLLNYLKRHPECRQDLIDLSLEMEMVETDIKIATEAVEDSECDNAWQAFVAAGQNEKLVSNPFNKFRGSEFASLCTTLCLPKSIVSPFRNRTILPNTIPSKLIAATASALGITIDALQTFLSKPPVAITNMEFKSARKPSTPSQVPFAKLIEDTELSEEQQQAVTEYLQDDKQDRS